MTNIIRPNSELKSFTCPHCTAVAHQTWYNTFEKPVDKKTGTPFRIKSESVEMIREKDEAEFPNKEILLKRWSRELSGEIFSLGDQESTYVRSLKNLHISRCYSCKKSALWIAHKLVWPETVFIVAPNEDMPENVKSVFLEASQVFKHSPRASAALLRLAIEELCNEINGTRDTIFNGIGKLVKNGLDPRIQKSLDIVRVTGNEAVHPGQLNFNDTPEDAERLFKLVNLIVENLITFPKELDEVYNGIPASKREAIEQRDGREKKFE